MDTKQTTNASKKTKKLLIISEIFIIVVFAQIYLYLILIKIGLIPKSYNVSKWPYLSIYKDWG